MKLMQRRQRLCRYSFWRNAWTVSLLLCPLRHALAASFPARLPATPRAGDTEPRDGKPPSPDGPPISWWSDTGGASSDDELESSDVDEESPLSWTKASPPKPSLGLNATVSSVDNSLSKDDGASRSESVVKTKADRQTLAAGPLKETESAKSSTATSSDRSTMHSESDKVKVGARKATAVAASDPEKRESTSQPLETLNKLQQMLDDTDYMTTRRRAFANPPDQKVLHQAERILEQRPDDPAPDRVSPIPDETEKLWTSKDRSKYKRQQRLRRAQLESARWSSLPQPTQVTSDDDNSDDTDDGWGYTLPNLPVYMSDGEGESDGETETAMAGEGETGQLSEEKSAVPPAPPPPGIREGTPLVVSSPGGYGYHYPPQQYYAPPQHYGPMPPDQYMSQYYSPIPYQSNGYHYPSYYPPQAAQSQPYGPWGSSGYAPPRPPQTFSRTPRAYPRPPPEQSTTPTPESDKTEVGMSNLTPKSASTSTEKPTPPVATYVPVGSVPVVISPPFDLAPMTFPNVVGANPETLAEASTNLSFDSIQKISLMLVTAALACYAAVSPRTLPLTEYNLQFYENFRIVSMATIAPFINMLAVFDAQENDVNSVINTFFVSFTLGYAAAFLTEILSTTLVRLAIFYWLERDVLSLTPRVPVPVLPWVLRESSYRPKRITLFAADFGTSCVAGPIIEEFIKLKVLQWTTQLPRNFRWATRVSSRTGARRRVAEPVVRGPGQSDVVNANKYVTHMLAASLGIKLCDAGRRILLYTKAHDANKSFYAVCRGLFPIHELCGTLTALSLAKRDLLGVEMPLWKMLLPGVVIHGMANFRGMKPIFKWNSATPWSEMQLLPWNVPDSSTLPQLLKKGFAKLTWWVILGRVLASCIKNYYMVNRRCVKRTTTYAGNHAAFHAELATADVLKKKK